jgi:hypothetical protein
VPPRRRRARIERTRRRCSRRDWEEGR